MADPVFSFARRLSQRVKVSIVTVTENSAFFQRERRIIHQRFGQFLSQRRHFMNFAFANCCGGQRSAERRRRIGSPSRGRAKFDSLDQLCNSRFQFRDLLQRSFQRDQIARVT